MLFRSIPVGAIGIGAQHAAIEQTLAGRPALGAGLHVDDAIAHPSQAGVEAKDAHAKPARSVIVPRRRGAHHVATPNQEDSISTDFFNL